jgi:hypothetical protein
MPSKKFYTVTAAIVGGCLAVYAVAGFIILPAVIASKAPQLVAETTGQRPQLRSVSFNPFSFQAEIEGFSLPSADGKTLIEFSRLQVNLDLLQSILQRGAIVSSQNLSSPIATLLRRADGSFNFNDLIPKASPAPANDEAKQQSTTMVLVHQLNIDHGQIVWGDATQGEQLEESLVPFNLNVEELSTHANGNSTFALALEAAGGSLKWHGELNINALSSSGQIQLDNLDLAKVWQLFLRKLTPLVITDGHLSLNSAYQFSTAEGQLQLLLDQGKLELKQLQLADQKKTSESLISVPSLTAQGIDFDLSKQQLSLASVSSNDATINAWLEKDGSINYQTLFAAESATNNAPAPVAADSSPSNPWHFLLSDLALNNYQINFTDRQISKPVTINLTELNCKLQNFKGIDGGKFPLQLSTRFNQNASLSINGEINPQPFTGDLTLDLRDLKLKTFQPYIDPLINLELVDGELSSQGHLSLNTSEPLQVQYQGDGNIDNLLTRDKVKFKDFVKWANLDVKQIAIDVAKQEFKFGKVIFDKPYVRFNIKKDRSTNIDDIISQPSSSSAIPDHPSTAANRKAHPEPIISISNIEIADGKSDFADYSLILPFVAEMNKLNGEVDGFVSNTDQAAKLSLKGKVYDLATVTIKGDYQFQSNDSNITLNFSHMPLPLVTPYMAEFAGYKIEKGQMALDLKYEIKHGQLNASNKIMIDQLKLGEKIDNPKAVSLPLELAVALLKDAHGKINLDFPISGSLEDPKFSIGSMLGNVLVNLITKVVTSPFKAIAAIAGSSSEVDLSTIGFAAGSSELTAAETDKLLHVSHVLTDKPELTLEIKGLAYLVQDWPTLRSAAVFEVLKKMKSGELHDQGEKILSEYIELSDSEYKRLLAKFYAEVLPSEIDFNVFGKPRMKHNPNVDFYQTAQLQLEAIMQPEEQKLNGLAIARSNNIASYLSEQAHIDRNRIYFLATETRTGNSEGEVNALLSLNVSQ